MSNTNRDFLIKYDIKRSNISIEGNNIFFYTTDKNVCNIFVSLVANVSTNPLISKYVNVENARNYILKMIVIKPNNEIMTITGELMEEETTWQFDLTQSQLNMAGEYKCQLHTITTVRGRTEETTSDPFGFVVKKTITDDVPDVIEPNNNYTVQLINMVNDIDSKLETKATKQEVDIERKRIDNLTTLQEGSTTGDAELIDARIGANGVTYNNLGTAIRKQFNAIVSDTSSSSTLTIDDSFTGKVISVDITGFKGQVVEFIISCDNSVLANNYGIQIGVTKSDGTSINAIRTVTPNKISQLKLDYNITKINAWIGSKLGNGDVVLTASIKNIFDYTYELNNKTDELNNKTENIKRFLCDNDLPNVYKVSNSVTIDTIKSFLVTVQGTFKKDEKINIRVDSDCINSNADIMIGITYPTGTKTDVARVKPNSYIEFTPTENATQIAIWVDKSHLNSTGTVTLSVRNFIPLKDKVDELDNKVDELDVKVDKLDNKISKSNYLQGLSFSILGDSYSTYEGWLPSNNSSWYRDTGNATLENDVAGVADTWWHKLSKDTGMSLLINDSYSGSTVSTSGYNGGDYTSICFTTRMVNTLGEKRTLEPKPNIIFIFGGTNDNWADSPIGELKHSDWSTEDLKSFLPAFCYMIAYIKKYNPQARIINITNTNLKSEVSNGMAEACQYYNIENVVLSNIGTTGSHPNKEGMEAIKNQIISIL